MGRVSNSKAHIRLEEWLPSVSRRQGVACVPVPRDQKDNEEPKESDSGWFIVYDCRVILRTILKTAFRREISGQDLFYLPRSCCMEYGSLVRNTPPSSSTSKEPLERTATRTRFGERVRDGSTVLSLPTVLR